MTERNGVTVSYEVQNEEPIEKLCSVQNGNFLKIDDEFSTNFCSFMNLSLDHEPNQTDTIIHNNKEWNVYQWQPAGAWEEVSEIEVDEEIVESSTFYQKYDIVCHDKRFNPASQKQFKRGGR